MAQGDRPRGQSQAHRRTRNATTTRPGRTCMARHDPSAQLPALGHSRPRCPDADADRWPHRHIRVASSSDQHGGARAGRHCTDCTWQLVGLEQPRGLFLWRNRQCGEGTHGGASSSEYSRVRSGANRQRSLFHAEAGIFDDTRRFSYQ